MPHTLGVLFFDVIKYPCDYLQALSLFFFLPYGMSALHICDAVDGREGAIHTIIDPFQHTQWHGIGIENLVKVGFRNWELIEKRSEHALPELDANNTAKYDLILIDGWHTFDHTISLTPSMPLGFLVRAVSLLSMTLIFLLFVP